MPDPTPDPAAPLTGGEINAALRQAAKVRRYQAGDVMVERPSVTELRDLQDRVASDEAQKARGGAMYVPIEFGD